VEIPLVDPEDVPVPPSEVRFRGVEVQPYGDGRRLRVRLELTPFLERPSIDLEVRDGDGGQRASAAIVETNEASMQLTLHVTPASPAGALVLISTIHYKDQGAVDRRETTFESA
jgi:hypothetical protein